MTDSATEHRNDVVEVEFTTDDTDYPFVALSDAEDCIVDLAEMIPRSDDAYAEYFTIEDADPHDVLDHANDADTADVTLVEPHDDGGLFEFLITDSCPASHLAALGALPHTIHATDGNGRITAEIPPQYDPATIIETFLDANPTIDFAAKRTRNTLTARLTDTTNEHLLDDALTDRQRYVLETALEHGYYDWPRDTTGEALADELNITPATFAEHIRHAERAILTTLLDNQR
jgi:predicted DNA binding protein